jgi:hypothetical protein
MAGLEEALGDVHDDAEVEEEAGVEAEEEEEEWEGSEEEEEELEGSEEEDDLFEPVVENPNFTFRPEPDPAVLIADGRELLCLKAFEPDLIAIRERRDIVLSFNQLGLDGAQRLARALESNTTLRTLRLEDFHCIRHEGVQSLAHAVGVNRGLEEFALVRNAVTTAGARAFAAALGTHSSLRRLDLSWNKIGASGAQALAAALATNRSLLSLVLQHNRFGAIGAMALAAALDVNRTLLVLDLSQNEGAEPSLPVIADRLRVNELAAVAVPAWVDATARKSAGSILLSRLPAFVALVCFSAFGDALVPDDGWQTARGREFATEYLFPAAKTALRDELVRLAAAAAPA